MTKMMCTKCRIPAEKVLLPTYEPEPGVVLNNAEAWRCPKCHEFVFDEKQMEKIEKRAGVVRAHKFAFERKFTVSGRSLVVNIPEDLVRHMKLRKGLKTKLW